MKKLKQCMYTIFLILTCLVASPLIFKQIWDSSKEVEPASSKKPPVIDIHSKKSRAHYYQKNPERKQKYYINII